MSILNTKITQAIDLTEIKLVQTKLPNITSSKLNEVADQLDHLTLSQKLDLVTKGFMVPINNDYNTLKSYIIDKSLIIELEKKLYNDFKNGLPENGRKSCQNCLDISQNERSCGYYYYQLQMFLMLSSCIIYDIIKQEEKIKPLLADLKQEIAVEYIKSIRITTEGFGLEIGRLMELIINNELFQTAHELSKQSLSDRYRICVERFKELKDISQYASWQIDDKLVFNKWLNFWNQENRHVSSIINKQSKIEKPKGQLINDIIEISIRILNRVTKLNNHEDYINDLFTDFLETKGYIVSDQKRIGNGRVDIAIKNEHQIITSSIEATKYHSNNVIEEHLRKLLHKYNETGNNIK